MNIMILVKWSTDWTNREENSPSIISLLIDIPLKVGHVSKPLWGDG
jgi:hypothetical protein